MAIDRRRILAMGAAALVPVSGRESAASPPAPAAAAVASTLREQAQALLDAVTAGDASVWERLLHEDCVYTSEEGEVFGKKKMVEQVKPLPAGVSGVLRVVDFEARVTGATAIATYVSDEHEDYHGQKLHCRYRSTDTWLKTPAGWRLLASQVLALRTDPPATEVADGKAEEYSGSYALAPGIDFEIRRKGTNLEGQQTGRPAREFRLEAPDVLFSPGRPRYRYVFQRGPGGKITGFAERREAWDLVWTKK